MAEKKECEKSQNIVDEASEKEKKAMKKFFQEFKEFAMRGNVMDMAVGVIIGTAFGKITTSLVNDVFMPLIGLLIGGVDLGQLNIVLKPEVLDEAGQVVTEAVTLGIGTFLSTVIDFVLVAFVIFLMVKTINQLHKLGIRNTVMMTGDSYRTAEAIAKQVGVDQFYAEVLPEDKANFVQKEKAAGHTVVMIGDGINDSPALSAADIGIAINSGAAIAREIADVTIKADSLEELVFLKTVANALQHRVSANYRFVLSFNSTLILLGALGILQPAASAMLHNLSTLGISLKSMTNLVQTPSSVPQIAK